MPTITDFIFISMFGNFSNSTVSGSSVPETTDYKIKIIVEIFNFFENLNVRSFNQSDEALHKNKSGLANDCY